MKQELNRAKGILLVALAVAAAGALVGYLGYRAQVGARRQVAVSKTDIRLCNVVRAIVTGPKSDPSDPSKAKPGSFADLYYQAHPQARETAQRRYDRSLRLLNCEHLPSVG